MNPLRNLLRSAARLLRQWRCKHNDTLRKTEGKRMYTECLRCEYQSKGVEIAGHNYASTKHQWEPTLVRSHLLTTAEVRAKLDAIPPVAIAPEPVIELGVPFSGTCNGEPARIAFFDKGAAAAYGLDVANPAYGAPEPATQSLCTSCGEPKEITRPKSKKCRACDRKRKPRIVNDYPRKKQRKPWNTPRKPAVKSTRKTSRKPSSKRSTNRVTLRTE